MNEKIVTQQQLIDAIAKILVRAKGEKAGWLGEISAELFLILFGRDEALRLLEEVLKVADANVESILGELFPPEPDAETPQVVSIDLGNIEDKLFVFFGGKKDDKVH